MPRLTTRDYKRPSRSSSAAKLKEFGLGVLVGAVLASAAFLIAGAHARHHAAASAHGRAGAGSSGSAPHAPSPDTSSSGASGGDSSTGSGSDSDSDSGSDPDSDSDSGSGSGSSPRSASSQTGVPATQYDFYRMLPSFKVPVPHDDDHPAHAPPPAATQPAGTTGSGPSYLLQVGSYRSTAEADQVRARLARAGISAQVQRIVEGSRTWNRVRIGPVSETELTKVREQLRTANIHALVIRAGR